MANFIIRCYCNLPPCVDTNYMCKSRLACFSEHLPPPSPVRFENLIQLENEVLTAEHPSVANQYDAPGYVNDRRGCLELKHVENHMDSSCEDTPSSAESLSDADTAPSSIEPLSDSESAASFVNPAGVFALSVSDQQHKLQQPQTLFDQNSSANTSEASANFVNIPGSTEVLPGNEVNRERRSSNAIRHRPASRLKCCKTDMCNYKERTILRDDEGERKPTGNRGRSLYKNFAARKHDDVRERIAFGMKYQETRDDFHLFSNDDASAGSTGLSPNLGPEYSKELDASLLISQQLWFKLAVILVPVCGLFMLSLLISVGCWLLQSQSTAPPTRRKKVSTQHSGDNRSDRASPILDPTGSAKTTEKKPIPKDVILFSANERATSSETSSFTASSFSGNLLGPPDTSVVVGQCYDWLAMDPDPEAGLGLKFVPHPGSAQGGEGERKRSEARADIERNETFSKENYLLRMENGTLRADKHNSDLGNGVGTGCEYIARHDMSDDFGRLSKELTVIVHDPPEFIDDKLEASPKTAPLASSDDTASGGAESNTSGNEFEDPKDAASTKNYSKNSNGAKRRSHRNSGRMNCVFSDGSKDNRVVEIAPVITRKSVRPGKSKIVKV